MNPPAGLPDISRLARWSVSSSKQGLGVANLLDSSTDTYWQSDGHQPHTIAITFPHRHQIHSISIYADYDRDESYTPCCIRILSGTDQYDLQLLKEVHFDTEPRTWIHFPLSNDDTSDHSSSSSNSSVMAHHLHLVFPLNYENGRDVRVRAVRLLGPPTNHEMFKRDKILPFTTPEFYMYDTLR